MLYKALVTDKETKEKLFIEFDSPTKKQFIQDLRLNGYSVSDQKVKKSEVYNWILNNTNCQEEDWYFNEIPKDRNEYWEKVEEFKQRVNRNKLMKRIKRSYR